MANTTRTPNVVLKVCSMEQGETHWISAVSLPQTISNYPANLVSVNGVSTLEYLFSVFLPDSGNLLLRRGKGAPL